MLIESSKNKTKTIKLLSGAIQRAIQSMCGSQKFRKQGTKQWVNFQKLWGLFKMFQKSTKNKIRGKKTTE